MIEFVRCVSSIFIIVFDNFVGLARSRINHGAAFRSSDASLLCGAHVDLWRLVGQMGEGVVQAR